MSKSMGALDGHCGEAEDILACRRNGILLCGGYRSRADAAGGSRQISALELHLNTRLFHRTTIAIALTVEGEKMIPMALQVLQAVDVLGEKGCIEGGAVSGKVRLSLPAPLGLYMSERFPVLLAGHPDLIIEMIFCEEPSDLVGNAIDLEVRLGPVADSSLICRRLGSTTACLVAAPSYLSRHAPPQSPAELTDHDCICYSRAGDGRTWSFSDGANEIPVRIAPYLIANNSVAVHRAALSGGGLAVLSHILVDADIQSGRLKRLMPAFPPTRLPISVVYPSRRNIPARVRTVLEFLVEAVDEDVQMASTAFA